MNPSGLAADSGQDSIAAAVLPLRLRRIPAPTLDPPYDDERDPAEHSQLNGWASCGSLPLPLPFGVPATVPRLRVVAAAAAATAPSAQGRPGPWAARFARALLEVLAGVRPVGQLAGWAAPDVCAFVARRVSAATRCRDLRRSVGAVRSLHVCEPGPAVAEVCAIVDLGSRVRAVALRLEGDAAGWRCTDLEIG